MINCVLPSEMDSYSAFFPAPELVISGAGMFLLPIAFANFSLR